MKSEWSKVPIKSVCLGIYDGPHATPPKSDSGAIFLGIPNFINGRLDFSDVRYISEEDLPKWTRRVTPQPHDVVFSYEATLNLYAIIPEGFYGCLGRRMALMRPDESKVDYRYLFYYMFSPAWRAEIEKHKVNGSTVDRIPLVHFPSFVIELPDITTQRHIADILSALDNKIELNQCVNDNLQQQLFTLFENIVTTNIPSDCVKLQELCDFQEGYVNPAQTHPEYFDGNIKWLRAVDINESFITNTSRTLTKAGFESAKKNAVLFKPNTIAISKSGTIGRLGIVADKMCGNRAVINIAPRNKEHLPFIYAYLKSRQREFSNMAVGSVQKNLYVSLLEPLVVSLPAPDKLNVFCEIGGSLLGTIYNNCMENVKLSLLRDNLLPKLMSGVINVSDIRP